jgi:hypothetical protein
MAAKIAQTHENSIPGGKEGKIWWAVKSEILRTFVAQL